MSATGFDSSRDLGLNTPFKLKVHSPLKHYLEFLTKKEQSIYSLREIFTILKRVIGEGGHFDKTNPSIIVLDNNSELERALCVKACHVSEVRNLVMKQIEVYPTQSQGVGKSFESVGQVSCSGADGSADKYFVKQDFLRVLSPRESCLKVSDQVLFSFEEVASLFSRYILNNRENIFDKRNLKVAIIKNDPLGVVLGIDYFHRCQASSIIRSQLVPYFGSGLANLSQSEYQLRVGLGSLSLTSQLQAAQRVQINNQRSWNTGELWMWPSLELIEGLAANPQVNY